MPVLACQRIEHEVTDQRREGWAVKIYIDAAVKRVDVLADTVGVSERSAGSDVDVASARGHVN